MIAIEVSFRNAVCLHVARWACEIRDMVEADMRDYTNLRKMFGGEMGAHTDAWQGVFASLWYYTLGLAQVCDSCVTDSSEDFDHCPQFGRFLPSYYFFVSSAPMITRWVVSLALVPAQRPFG